ncbi:MAG: 2-oxo acid dehydrogenase subunit E2, partial [Myxococcales bacterium]|nr:2-oxo acid dehydrogenase subunit E2 [Myxococcales bacterium]
DGNVEIRNQLTITATIDHRFIDGFQGGVLAKVVKEVMLEPWKLDGLARAPWAETETPAIAASSPA